MIGLLPDSTGPKVCGDYTWRHIVKLTGRTILITGGSSGIGLELARGMFALGNVVIVTGRDEAKLRAAEKEICGTDSPLRGSGAVSSGYPSLSFVLLASVSASVPLNVVMRGLTTRTCSQSTVNPPLETVRELLKTLSGDCRKSCPDFAETDRLSATQ